jgi:hypothetical protein
MLVHEEDEEELTASSCVQPEILIPIETCMTVNLTTSTSFGKEKRVENKSKETRCINWNRFAESKQKRRPARRKKVVRQIAGTS